MRFGRVRRGPLLLSRSRRSRVATYAEEELDRPALWMGRRARQRGQRHLRQEDGRRTRQLRLLRRQRALQGRSQRLLRRHFERGATPFDLSLDGFVRALVWPRRGGSARWVRVRRSAQGFSAAAHRGESAVLAAAGSANEALPSLHRNRGWLGARRYQ